MIIIKILSIMIIMLFVDVLNIEIKKMYFVLLILPLEILFFNFASTCCFKYISADVKLKHLRNHTTTTTEFYRKTVNIKILMARG